MDFIQHGQIFGCVVVQVQEGPHSSMLLTPDFLQYSEHPAKTNHWEELAELWLEIQTTGPCEV